MVQVTGSLLWIVIFIVVYMKVVYGQNFVV